MRVFRKWNVDAGGAFDFAYFSQKHIKDDPVDRIVSAIKEAGLNLVGLLAEAVDAPLPLFETVWIPRKIVVKDASEELLQVDAFAEAVGGE